MLETPVVLIIFNRPKQTAAVFQAIRSARPTHLFIIADSPRTTVASDNTLCQTTRQTIANVDWPCTVLYNFSDHNLGNARRISSGLTWVFEQVTEAIILEDDCLPTDDFFQFCQQLLSTYRHDERVAMISGYNALGRWRQHSQSYHFSRYGSHWGFATWRRVWEKYDATLPSLTNQSQIEALRTTINNAVYADYFVKMTAKIRSGQLDTWDHAFTAGQLLRQQVAIVPAVSMVTNIGFGKQAAHTVDALSLNAYAPTYPLEFPLSPPHAHRFDQAFDTAYQAWRLGRPDPALVIQQLTARIKNGQHAHAFILLTAFIKSKPKLTRDQRQQVQRLRQQLLIAMRRPKGSGDASS